MSKIPTVTWSKTPRVVILDGSEDWFKSTLEAEAREVLSDFEQVFIWAGIDSDHQIADALFEGSFISQRKLVIVRDANKGSEEILTSYCEDPNPDYVLVLSSSGGRKPQWWSNLKHTVKVDCKPLKRWEYKDWAIDYARLNGYSLSEKYAESIYANVGEDLFALANELQKIFLNTDGTSIGVKNITSVLVPHTTLSPFKVVDAWAMGQGETALKMATIFFHQSTDSYSSLVLISTLLKRIEQMIAVSSYRLGQFPDDDIQTRMSLSSFQAKPLFQQAANWKIRRLRMAYSELCNIEAMVKRGSNGELLVQWFLTQNFEEK